jgi:hypothetical protein
MSEDPTPPVDPEPAPAPAVPRAPHRRVRTIVLSIVTGAAALALAVAGIAALAPAGGPTSSSTSRAGAGPSGPASPSASPSPGASAGAATSPDPAAVLGGLLAAGADASSDPSTGTARVDDVATGALLAEIANDQQELAAFGWTRTGTPKIVSAAVLSTDPAATPAQMVVRACIDSTGVTTYDSEGAPLPSDPTVVPRSLSDFTLIDASGRWLVADRSYPDDPQC